MHTGDSKVTSCERAIIEALTDIYGRKEVKKLVEQGHVAAYDSTIVLK
jgi:copper chaperone CopZ